MDFSRASFNRQKHVFISLNDLCNQRCTYCYLSEDNISRSKPVDVEALSSKLAHLYKEHEFRLVTIAGGEPGLVSNLPAIIEAMAGIGYDIIIDTNGTLGSRRIREIRKFNIRAISFSLDSHDKGVNDRLRFSGCWDLVQKGVMYCRQEAIPVRVSAVVCRLNRHDVSGLLELCGAWGVEVLNIHELDTSVNSQVLGPLKLSPAEWRELVRALAVRVRNREHYTALRIPVSYTTEGESKRIAENQLSCPAMSNDTLCVSPDLAVYRCPLLLNRQRVSYKDLGDFLETEPLDGLEASHDCARCPLSEQDSGERSGFVDACKLVKLTINKGSVESNTPIWSDILKHF
jgi:MoaA/NifB/PqqE/SkfB family radical SAM enzyme